MAVTQDKEQDPTREQEPPADDGSGSSSDAIRYERLVFDVPESIAGDARAELLTYNGSIQVEEVDESAWPLVRKVAAAMNETQRIEKRGQAAQAQGGYKYATVEDMLNMVREPLFRRGVILLTRPRGFTEHVIKSSNNNEGTRLVVKVDFEFMDDTTSFKIEGWEGEGQDYGDKAYGKAYTNAIKTFVRTQWLLPTGDDPEASDPGERRAPAEAKGDALPGWAKEANDKRKQEALNALAQVIGHPKAIALLGGVKDHFGHVPDIVVGVAKNIATAHAGLNVSSADRAAAREERAEADRRHAEAEKAPDEPSPEDPAGDASPEPEALDEQPPPGVGGAPDPEKPAPGSIPRPDMKGLTTRAAREKALRDAGCICNDPLAGDDDGETECPISGHGIPF